MKKGEVARFIFSPNYAYGQQGCLPLIPPNATVLFEVELIDFLDSADSDTFFALTAVSCFNKARGINLEDKLCCLSLQLLRIMCYICLFNAGAVIQTLGCWIRADADMCPLKLILHALPCLQPSAGGEAGSAFVCCPVVGSVKQAAFIFSFTRILMVSLEGTSFMEVLWSVRTVPSCLFKNRQNPCEVWSIEVSPAPTLCLCFLAAFPSAPSLLSLLPGELPCYC